MNQQKILSMMLAAEQWQGLTHIVADYLQESRSGRNIRHHLVPLLRQSIYGRLAGYDDTNDAERLSQDPAMRVVVVVLVFLNSPHMLKTSDSNSKGHRGPIDTQRSCTGQVAALVSGSDGIRPHDVAKPWHEKTFPGHLNGG